MSHEQIDYSIEGHSLDEIVNFNEHLVLGELRKLYAKDTTLCRCNTCVEDLYALALNQVPPRYLQVTSRERYQSDQDRYISSTVVGEVLEKVAATVKAKPNHD